MTESSSPAEIQNSVSDGVRFGGEAEQIKHEEEESNMSDQVNTILSSTVEAGKQKANDIIDFQTEFLKYFQSAGQNWLSRMQSQSAMVSELATKLAASRSVQEASAIYEDWTNREMALLMEDGKQLIADMEKLMATGGRTLGNGWGGQPASE